MKTTKKRQKDFSFLGIEAVNKMVMMMTTVSVPRIAFFYSSSFYFSPTAAILYRFLTVTEFLNVFMSILLQSPSLWKPNPKVQHLQKQNTPSDPTVSQFILPFSKTLSIQSVLVLLYNFLLGFARVHLLDIFATKFVKFSLPTLSMKIGTSQVSLL